MVSKQTEIQGISLIDWQEKAQKRTTLLSDSIAESVKSP